MKQKLVVIGNGMAPGRMLEHLFETAPDAYEVTIFNAEPRVNYDRILLSPVLSGEKGYEEIIIHGDGWYIDRGIMLYKGHKVVRIDREAKTVTSEHGETASYDKLVIATGSNPLIIPVPGRNLPGVITYRDLDDVRAMLLAAQSRKKAVVIGGGLLGLEAAAGLRARDMDVTVVHLMPTLMERQLDPAAGYLLQRALEERGIKVMTKANTAAIVGNGRIEGVELADSTVIPATLVVMAVGIKPNAALAREAGLAVERGIVVDPAMRTSDPDIFALGECAEVDGQVYGLVAPLYEMAKVAAAHLSGDTSAKFTHADTPTKLKVTGIDLYSLGDFGEGDDREEIVLRDAAAGVYKRLVIKENRIIGTVLYGETADGAWFNDLKRKRTDISEMRETLIFGQAYQGGAPLDPAAAVAALPDDAEICGCNGVCKGKIVATIRAKALTTLDDVRAHTKASSSCGTCTGLVEKLMMLTLGDAYNPSAVHPVCGCTDLSHDDVRRLIKAKKLKTIPQLMQELEWKTSCGCAKCRPALNYYMLADWPGDYADDYQSRFINERAHANIQKDGTYSVVPRMWGGQTSAKELRTIADVVEKFSIPTVKLTGGQRIDMLGVRKEDLPAVWAELGKAGFVSGHAYAKGLRTVKTCVGTDWCRFGTQDSTGLAVRIEKFMWGSWTPAKVKMAVSGCPRNCAEATCKDVGVVCVEQRSRAQLAREAALREYFLHSVTHDLRQPINALGLFLLDLRRRLASGRDKEVLDASQSCIASANGIIDSVAQLAWIKEHLPHAEIEEVALNPVLERVTAECKPLTAQKSLGLRFKPTSLTVKADLGFLERAIRNLLHNAIQYTDEGRVLLGARRRPDGLAEIQVLDSGRGVSPEEQTKIFDEFYQAPAEAGRALGNVGLGLSIVTNLAEAMGGRVTFGSVEGKGSMFGLVLPRSVGYRRPRNAGDGPSALEGKSVLLIEDNEAYSQIISEMLAAAGLKVRAVCSPGAIAAIGPATVEEQDLLIADYQLAPGLTALDLLAPCRADVQRRCLIISEHSLPQTVQEIKRGGWHFLRKPFTNDMLLGALTRLVA